MPAAPSLPPSFAWNWAELAESAAKESVEHETALARWPHLPLFMAARSRTFEAPDALSPSRSLLTPEGIPGLPARLNFAACCLLNPIPEEGAAWLRWAIAEEPQSEAAQLLMEALTQLPSAIGPMNVIAPELLRETLGILRSPAVSDDDAMKAWLDGALVRLFQPFDDRPEAAEDWPYAPCCELLLSSGARAGARDALGNSPLSGINFMLTEAEVSMADPRHIKDLLWCAQLLLDAGAATESVRPRPPLAHIVHNTHFRELLVSREERLALMTALDEDEVPPKPAATSPRTSKRL